MNLQRREFFAILGVCVTGTDALFAQHDHHMGNAEPNYADYRPRAFTQAEYDLLDEMAETILPTDETGPGAHDAHVAYYIDVVLFHSKPERLQSWRHGFAHIEALTGERFQQGFVACSASQRRELLAALATNEMEPQTEMDHFFVEFKRIVIDGFYASELIQREHLGYQGNTAIAEFAGCTHPNFEHPDLA